MNFRRVLSFLLPLCLALALFAHWQRPAPSYSLGELPPYDSAPAVILSGNQPDFLDRDKTSQAFERYSQLDYFGRCGPAYANVGLETMPTQERGPIWQIKPSGWQTTKYDFVDGQNLYNRCHLIGYQLTAENANELNLITGTRYFNVQGMLPYEIEVADYVKETGNHVLYRVTPVFEGADLVARGVEMEALSVEDEGKGVCFHVFVYNVQPGVTIDYATGESWLSGQTPPPESQTSTPESQTPEPDSQAPVPPEETTATEDEVECAYVLNLNSHRFHLPTCSGAGSIKESNRQEYFGIRSALIASGYVPCGSCNP